MSPLSEDLHTMSHTCSARAVGVPGVVQLVAVVLPPCQSAPSLLDTTSPFTILAHSCWMGRSLPGPDSQVLRPPAHIMTGQGMDYGLPPAVGGALVWGHPLTHSGQCPSPWKALQLAVGTPVQLGREGGGGRLLLNPRRRPEWPFQRR